MIGRTLSHFKITAKLGEGGMGEVYRAKDTKLGREVALKVLPEAVSADPERLARFDREARVVASLNHPSIAAIHSVEHDDSLHFLAMELAEGEDLGQRIARGPIPLDEALPIALQIAEALEFAHDKEVVHRDLKPANVMLADDGTVKVLDFGLAKAFGDSEADLGVALEDSPTFAALTQHGIILGTAGYMSPEQARGRVVDKRADIWAFGAVLYEMLAGKRLFDGPSVTDILAAVMRAEIDLEAVPDEVPPEIRRLLVRCLDRDPKNRLRDIGEARIGIAEALSGNGAAIETSFATGDEAPTRAGFRRLMPWLIAALAIGAVAVLGGLQITRPETNVNRTIVHSSIRFPDGVRLAGWSSPAVALSPDERTLAFVGHRDGRQQLYLRRLDEPEAVLVPESDGAEGPFFSPDSRWVGFGAGDISRLSGEPPMLKRAPVNGGSAQPLVPLQDYAGGSWGTDGYIYYSDGFLKGGLRRVREAGGEAEPIFSDSRGEQLGETAAIWPQHIGDGGRLLLTATWTSGDGAIALDLDTGALEDLDQPAVFSRYSTGGHLVFAQMDGVLRTVPFDPASLRKTGAAIEVVRDIAFSCNNSAVFAVGGSGSAVYSTGFVRGSDRVLSRLVRIDPSDGSVERLPFEPNAFGRHISLAPDGKRIITSTWDGELWIYDLERVTRLKVPDGGIAGDRQRPTWSPDGKTLAFSIEDDDRGGIHVYAQAADGTGDAWLLGDEPGESFATGWTPDGRELVFYRFPDVGEATSYRVAALGGGQPTPLELASSGTLGVVSPDGNWLAYQSSETGRREVYIEPYPDGGAVIPVSSDGGTSPRWSASGGELYYTTGCQLIAVEAKLGAKLELGRTRTLFEHCDLNLQRERGFEVDSEGFFYLLEAVPESGIVTSLDLVLHWSDEIARAFTDG